MNPPNQNNLKEGNGCYSMIIVSIKMITAEEETNLNIYNCMVISQNELSCPPSLTYKKKVP